MRVPVGVAVGNKVAVGVVWGVTVTLPDRKGVMVGVTVGVWVAVGIGVAGGVGGMAPSGWKLTRPRVGTST